ncbi:MAG: YqgE/AlgH family protein [Tetrasphaera sp.]
MDAPANLTGRLLVATPEIGDGVFRRSVVLVLHHGDDGAQGIILNRPLEAEVDAVLPRWGRLAVGGPQVYYGGPVQTDSALGVVSLPGGALEPNGIKRLYDEVALVDLEADPDDVGLHIQGMRVFVGYAGWSPGQLENEIATGSWYVVDRVAGDALALDAERLWRLVLARQFGPLSLLATFPDDPSLN